MKEFTFAIDCDEVLRDNIINMLEVYNKEYNDNKTVEDIFDFDVDKVFTKVKETTGASASKYFFEQHSKEVFSDAVPMPFAKEAVDILRKYGKVIVVTYQKNTENRYRTLKWLDDNNILYDGICFLRDKTLVHADYLIDDNDWNFYGCNCKHGILISKQYNKYISCTDLKNKSNCKTMDKFTSLYEFAKWFESNIEIFEKYE